MGALSPTSSGGDSDPLDICVLSERPIDRAEIVVRARIVGGLQMVDNGEADDKIIAVLKGDHIWGQAGDISDIPSILVERLRHYFTTYKMVPGKESAAVIESVYGVEHACRVVQASLDDYDEVYGRQ